MIHYFLHEYAIDVLCDSYSQRVFASFGLLDSYNKGYFTLDDFVDRGLIVEEFLSLNVNTKTSFRVMVISVLYWLILPYSIAGSVSHFSLKFIVTGFFS